MNSEWIGFIAAALTSISFLPQALMAIRTRNTRDVSLGMYLLFTVGVALWIVYGVAVQAWPVVAANVITLALAGTVLTLKLRFG